MGQHRYDHAQIEAAAQERWEQERLYEVDLAAAEQPAYILTEFPYPSGDLHTGHWYAFALTDIYARYQRMQGKDVLFPFGFDAFGLPAENAAITRGLDPRAWTLDNMASMRAQVRQMGTSLDWSKEVVTCDPSYYQWTQWIFLKLYEQGLAERRAARVKWCPKDKTVLANEQVVAGSCERCGTTVEERELTQWFLSITSYAQRLLDDLAELPWREEIKDAQRAWIGASEGARIPFTLSVSGSEPAEDASGTVEVFTTRPDTLFGVTYLVLAPEHPLVSAALAEGGGCTNPAEVAAYVQATSRRSERERLENREKTGVRLAGIDAHHPLTGALLPIYLADYVLAGYGTGAVMAVPAHDERDFVFARTFNLPITQVVMPRLPDPSNPHQEGKEVVHRRAAIIVVYDPATDRYLTLRWKEQPWTTFVTGGIEEGEDPVEGARREVAEETGYTDLRFVRYLGGDCQAEFYAAHKGVNRVARNSLMLFELASDARSEVDAAETAQHEAVWLPATELASTRFQHSEIDLIRERIRTGIDAYGGSGVLIDSGAWTGMQSEEARWAIAEAAGGTRTTTYRLRDWLVSRQRYWGCPIPMVYDPEGTPHPVPAEHLPWLLPEDVDFSAASGSPLATSTELKERTERLFGPGWTPEVDTLDTFVDSSWYFLRYLAPKRSDVFSDASLMAKWLPIDRYSGGSEHTTMHLLYARFLHKALYDLALVPTAEPFAERFNRGLIMGPDGQKMSKSKGNVVNPDEYVQRYGADAVRTYLAFIGPYNEPGHYPWRPEGVESMRRFLDRVYALQEKIGEEGDADIQRRACARATVAVGESIDRFKLNTGVSALMVLVNALEAEPAVRFESYDCLVRLLAPYAPHLAEHLATVRAGASAASVHASRWPIPDPADLVADTVIIGVQVAGKRRGEVTIPADASEDAAVAAAVALPDVVRALGSSQPGRVVYVPGRILNLLP